jgi:hypothetical protein
MTSGTKPGGDPGGNPAEALAEEAARVAEAYRRMPHSKFALRLEPYGDRAQAGHWLAAQFAALAQGVEEWDRPEPPRWRELPVLGPFALGDQLAVTAGDLLRAYRKLKEPAATYVWTPGDSRVPAEKALAVVLDSTTALRLVL